MIIDNKLDYKIMFNACSNEMAFTDFITGKIIDVNESWIRATGYDRQTSIGKTALELQLWADPEDRTKCLAEILKKGKFVGLETKLVMKSVQVPYLISGELVEMEQIKYILWEFQNNSEQTKINDALIKNEETVKLLLSESENSRKILLSILEDEKLAREAFQHSESQFRELWESTIEGIVIHDQGIILQVNNALCQMFGYQREMAIGKSLFDFISNDNESFIREHLASGLKDRFETEVIHKTGEKIIIDVYPKTILYGGKPVRMVAIVDISERKQAESLLKQKTEEIEAQNEEYSQINEELIQTNEELIKSKERAEESDRLKSAFLQNVSHEIRTPMNAIMGFSQLIVENYNNKSKLEKFAGIIHQRCNDLLDIISDILDTAKIESGQLTVSSEECNLTHLFYELTLFFNEYQKRISKPNIEFKLMAPKDSVEHVILTDKVKLKQILINLISNAFKFTDYGKIEGTYKIENNRNLVFSLTDTGIGIPTEKLNLIFERFTQVSQVPNRLYGGTGLGLPIAKGLVMLLGGEIWVESEIGKGSTFYFSIPYMLSKQSITHQRKIDASVVSHFPNKTILIVEDDFYNAEYLKEILIRLNLNILYTSFGKEAVQICKMHPIDLVLMDIRLPDIDGYLATSQIKEQFPDMKVIAQTAYASNDEKQKAIDAGCNDYISKPTSQEALVSIVTKYITT